MVLFCKHTSLLITSILLGLIASPGMGWAQKTPEINSSDVTPAYPPSPPPPRVEPLPDERGVQEHSPKTDYRVGNLLADVSGNLWVGSGRGLSRIDPKTGKIISRVSLPSIAIGALAQDKVGRL
ncbi:MAG: transcriptional regulator, partial [Nostoc sp.]